MSTPPYQLSQSNPNGIVAAPQDSIFHRVGKRYLLIRGTIVRDLALSSKVFASSYIGEVWYPSTTNENITYATSAEIWKKVSGNGKTGWVLKSNKSILMSLPPEIPWSAVILGNAASQAAGEVSANLNYCGASREISKAPGTIGVYHELTEFIQSSCPDVYLSNVVGDYVGIDYNPIILPSSTPTPPSTPTPTPTVTPTVTSTFGITPTPSITPTITASVTPTITETPTPTPTVTPTTTPAAGGEEYIPPLSMAPSASGYFRGFAADDFASSGPWSSSNANRTLGTVNMSDDGKLVYVFETDSPVMGYILERSASLSDGFALREVNLGTLTDIWPAGMYYSTNQISRNGVIIAKGNGGTVSALWKDGYLNPPVTSSNVDQYQLLTIDGTYVFGHDAGVGMRTKVADGTTELTTDQGVLAVNYAGTKIAAFKTVESGDTVTTMFTRSLAGVWGEDPGEFRAGIDIFPYITGMSGDGTIVIGDNLIEGAYRWDMNALPIGGVREAIVLPNPDQSASMGNAAYCESISSDGSVIVGSTVNGHSIYWVGPDFNTCSVFQDYIYANSTGPQFTNATWDGAWTASAYKVRHLSNTYARVSYLGEHVAMLGEKNSLGEPRSLVYMAPTVPLSVPPV